MLTSIDGCPDRLLPLGRHLGVEVDLDVGPGQSRGEVGGPFGQAVALGDLHQLLLVAADQNRLGPQPPPVREREAALIPDGQQRTHQVLAVPHPAGHAVERDADPPAFHRDPPSPVW
jgi:hypothetical protein